MLLKVKKEDSLKLIKIIKVDDPSSENNSESF